MTETIILPEAWIEKGTKMRVTVYIEDGVLKRTVTDRRFGRKPLFTAAKLSYAQADEIRKEFAKGGVTKVSLAKRYNVSECTVRNVIAGRTYV